MGTNASIAIVLFLLLTIAVGRTSWLAARRRSLSRATDQKQKKRSSDIVIMIGLTLSSVLDPAVKNRVETLDSQMKRKIEPGRENE